MKVYGGSGCIDPHFLDFGSSWRWVVSFTPRALYPPGESTPGTLWIWGWVGPRAGLDDREKRKILPPPGLEPRPLGRPARSQSLSRLSGNYVEEKILPLPGIKPRSCFTNIQMLGQTKDVITSSFFRVTAPLEGAVTDSYGAIVAC
jgi:hypothetical protein